MELEKENIGLALSYMEALMRKVFNTCLAFILIGSMAGTPFVAAPANAASSSIGVVLQAEDATIDTGMIRGGETIYDGDHLKTGDEGTLRARMGGSQMYLRRSTSAQVHYFVNGFSAALTGGSVVLSSPEGQAFLLMVNGATIRPANSQAATTEVTWISPKQIILTPSRGAIQISMGDEVKTIEPGASYRMEIETADPSPQSVPPHAASNHFIIVVIAGLVGGATYGIVRALVSPSAP